MRIYKPPAAPTPISTMIMRKKIIIPSIANTMSGKRLMSSAFPVEKL